MRFRGILVRPLADQGDRDGTFIDPTGVAFIEGRDYPLWAEFDFKRPLGYATVSRAEDGSLVVEGAITETDPQAVMGDPPKLAAGIVASFYADDILDGIRRRVVTACRLNAVSLTANHADPGQPPIEEVEE